MNINAREAIRTDLLLRRRNIERPEQIAGSQAVAQRVVQQLEATDSKGAARPAPVVAAYQPIGGEIDPTPALTILIERGWRIALPVCGENSHMEFCPWQPGDEMVSGPYGISEPKTSPIDIGDLSAVIVPAVGYDREGNRIGHGAGFYDRFFARTSQHEYAPYRLGLAYDFQIVELPTPEPWDVPVHCVITPSELIGS